MTETSVINELFSVSGVQNDNPQRALLHSTQMKLKKKHIIHEQQKIIIQR